MIDKLYNYQPIVEGFVYDRELKNYFYRPMIDSGLRPDVIDAGASLDKYSLIFSPFMPILDEYGLPERIAEWVKDGGVWVTGPMTDIRTADGTKYRDRLHGMLESLTPAQLHCFVPDHEKTVAGQWKDGSAFGGNMYYELFQPAEGANLVTVRSGSKYIEGLSILQQYKVGRGTVIILGTLPDYDDMRKLIAYACKEAGIVCDRTEGNSIQVADRKGEDKEGMILVDICGRGGVYHNSKPLCDLLTGNKYTGDITVEPYSVLVLESC